VVDIGAVLILFLCGMVYMLPYLLATKKVHATGILILNIFLGWTLLGWVGALVWAVSDPDAPKK